MNTTINVTAFSITFDQLDVLDNAITFYNLSYAHPSGCQFSPLTGLDLFNYTTPNKSISSSTAFPPSVCGGTKSGGVGDIIEEEIIEIPSDITEVLCTFRYFTETEFLSIPFDIIGGCILDKINDLGNKIWPGNGKVGFLIIVLLILSISFFIWRVKKTRHNKELIGEKIEK